jgi:stage II sporulation protein AA (anti-sigma F factor antagonist)
MEILQDRVGQALVVVPRGRLDGASAPELREALGALDAAGERRIVVDLAAVDYMSSAGLAVLLWLAKRMREAGGSMALCAVEVQVQRVFNLAGYIQYFTIVATRDDAVAAVSA